MGPTLARMARRASDAAGGTAARHRRRAVLRRRPGGSGLQSHGVETIRCDLLDPAQLDRLPDAANVVFMAGMKFGSTGQESLTWAMNTYLPGDGLPASSARAASSPSRPATSTAWSPVAGGGSRESDALEPGRRIRHELPRPRADLRALQPRRSASPIAIIRLNYADRAALRRARRHRAAGLRAASRSTWHGLRSTSSGRATPTPWRSQSFAHARRRPPLRAQRRPAPRLLSVRAVAERVRPTARPAPLFTGAEAADALLSNADRPPRSFGSPRVDAEQMIDWIADWVARGGATLGKPTQFEVARWQVLDCRSNPESRVLAMPHRSARSSRARHRHPRACPSR